MARGCLFFALPAWGAPQLGGVSLRAVPTGVHAADQARLQRARRAAEGAIAAIATSTASPEVAGAVGSKIAALWDKAVELGLALGRGRAFLAEFAPDRLARTRAELEIRALEVSAAEQKGIEQERVAFDQLAHRAGEIRGDVSVLEARLEAAIATMEALRGAAERIAVGGATVIDALAAEEAEAQRAVEAFARTIEELGR